MGHDLKMPAPSLKLWGIWRVTDLQWGEDSA